jgi:Immunity protein 27
MDTPFPTLAPQEAVLVGTWVNTPRGVVADETSRRIEALIHHRLKLVAEHPEDAGWTTLFQDPTDGRYWERTYPQSALQGGGPPTLQNLGAAEARARYQL